MLSRVKDFEECFWPFKKIWEKSNEISFSSLTCENTNKKPKQFDEMK